LNKKAIAQMQAILIIAIIGIAAIAGAWYYTQPAAEEEPEPTATPAPTAEPEPTATPAPTAEPEPTATPAPTAEPEPTPEPEPVEVKHLTIITEQTAGSLRDAVELLTSTFNEANADVEVTHQPMDHVSFNTVLSIWLATDAAPDLHQWWGGARTEELVDLGYVLALTSVWDDIKDEWPEGVQNGHMKYHGIPHSVPTAVFTYGLYYMVDIFEEYDLSPPTTWDELVAACETIWTESGETVYPFQVPSMFPWLPDLQFTTILSQSVSADFFRGLISGTESWQDASVVAALEAYAQLVPYMPPYHTELGEFEGTQELAEGRVAMEISGPWRSSMLQDAGLTPIEDFNWVPCPQILPEFATQMPTHSDVIIANVHTHYPEEAKRFLAFVASAEAQALYATTAGVISGNDAVDTGIYDDVQQNFLSYMSTTTDSLVEVSLAVREEVVGPWFDALAAWLQAPEDVAGTLATIDAIAWAPPA
jgi:multiple sugar transport system substrate-binding protein